MKALVFLGSRRQSSPPQPARLGNLATWQLGNLGKFNQASRCLCDAQPIEDSARWMNCASRGTEQLHWWAVAAAYQWQALDPFHTSPPFTQTPLERDAPEA